MLKDDLSLRAFIVKKNERNTFVKIYDKKDKVLGVVGSSLNDYVKKYGDYAILDWWIINQTALGVRINCFEDK